MDSCIFCKIAKGEIPSVKIWEDEKYFAFLDVNPVASGHTLLIPKKHADYIFDLNNEEYIELLLKAKEIAKILKKKFDSKRIGMVVEGFGMSHVHIHLIPINNMNQMDSINKKSTNLNELEKIAEKILK